MNAKLIRRFYSDNSGTIGELFFDDKRFCFTKELLWVNNERFISCIPSGKYICKKIKSEHFDVTFEVVGVKNRYDILFHWGSYVKNSKGCILVGSLLLLQKDTDDEILLTHSRDTHRRMMQHLYQVKEFKLEISDPFNIKKVVV